jgi:hypothetical protein
MPNKLNSDTGLMRNGRDVPSKSGEGVPQIKVEHETRVACNKFWDVP